MLKNLKAFFQEHLGPTQADPAKAQQRLQLACAALLIEVARADTSQDGVEVATLRSVMQVQFTLDDSAMDELVQLAEVESDMATSLYEFTQLINDEFSIEEKFQLMRWMWQVAYADGEIDKYEEHLIRKLGDLLYIPHQQFIRAKLEADPSQPAGS